MTITQTTNAKSFFSTDTKGYAINGSNPIGPNLFHPLQTFFSLLNLPQQIIGSLIRDRLFLPLNYPDQTTKWDIKGNLLLLDWLMGKKEIPNTYSNYKLLQKIKQHFTITAKKICVEAADKSQTIEFQTYFIESNKSISGNGLTYILVSFYGNKVIEKNQQNTQEMPWIPDNIKSLSGMLPAILMNLKENNISVDSLQVFSLGGATLESLQTPDMIEILPRNLILNRSFTSSDKVANALYSLPYRILLTNLAWITKWYANPEQTILTFFKRVAENKDPSSLKNRTCIIFKATKDNFFGENNSFAKDFESKLKQTGLKVFSGEFYASDIPLRSQHSTSLNDFVAIDDSQKETGTDRTGFLEMKEGESLAHALANFFNSFPEKERHICLNIGGSRENLAPMVKSILPVLEEFLKLKKS